MLEVGARIGASVAGSLLAQLGANVVFVEAAQTGGFAQPKWSWRDQFAAGKLSLVMGTADAGLLAQLAARSDVILLSSDVDALAFGSVPLKHSASGAIVCDVTAYGSSGPLTGTPATDAEIQALAGVMDATGLSDGPPIPLALPLVEQLAGVYAAAGVLAALRQRRQDGTTPPVEIALYDVAFSAMTSFLAPALFAPERDEPSRVGNRHTMAAPWNVYRAQDGWVLLCAGNDDQWTKVCELIGQQERGQSQRLARNADRVTHADEVDALVQAWIEQRSIANCVEHFLALGVPCGPVAPLDNFPREANLEHRGMVLQAQAPDGRRIALPASALRMSASPGITLSRVPAPNADRSTIVAASRGPVAAAPARPAGAVTGRLPLAGVRVVEIGHYTTAPVATRLLAALGAEVIKVEPLEGEAVRRWPPARNGQGIFFTFQNADKRSLALDMGSPAGAATLKRLVGTADVLVENLRPGALARKGFGPADLLALNPRLVYCSISGFGADSLYEGRPAFDTVIQAMSGMMAITRIGDMPLKTGPSMADVMGAAFGMVAILGALEHRETSGRGQAIDLSMQDICAWATQTGWNGASTAVTGPQVVRRGEQFFLRVPDSQEVPVLSTRDVVGQPQTQARGLWAWVPANDTEYPVLASPVRIGGTGKMPLPGPALGQDNESILRELA